MAKYRVLTDSELYEGPVHEIEHDDKIMRFHREIEMLINNGHGDKTGEPEQESKLILQALNCSELKLSSLSINTSLNKYVRSSNREKGKAEMNNTNRESQNNQVNVAESAGGLTNILSLSQTEGTLMKQPGKYEAPSQIHIDNTSSQQILLTDDLMTSSDVDQSKAEKPFVDLSKANCGAENKSLNGLI